MVRIVFLKIEFFHHSMIFTKTAAPIKSIFFTQNIIKQPKLSGGGKKQAAPTEGRLLFLPT